MTSDSDRQRLQSLVDSAQHAIAQKASASTLELPYTPPDHRPSPEIETLDWLRAGIFALAAALLMVTVLAFTSNGTWRPAADLLSVSRIQSYAWPVISIFLLLSSLFALLPQQVSTRRQRAVSIYPSIMAATMGCALTFSASFLPWAAVVLAAISCIAGFLGIRELNRHTARNTLERLLTDAPLSLCTGFSLVFTAQLFFAAAEWNGQTHAAKALLALLALAVMASVAAHSERGRHALALGFVAGTLAVALAQWLDGAGPWWLSIASVLCGLVVVVAAENRRHQITHAEHRIARGMPVDS